MDSGGIDLKTLIEHDLRMAQTILETSRKLVNELGSTHFWTTTSNDVFNSLSNIFINMSGMINTFLSDNEAGSSRGTPDEIKLWKTAFGLYRALPNEQKRFNDQVTRRRRERIMGDAAPEDLEIEAEILEEDNRNYETLGLKMEGLIADLVQLAGRLPAGLTPPEEPQPVADAPAMAQAAAAEPAAAQGNPVIEAGAQEPVSDDPVDDSPL